MYFAFGHVETQSGVNRPRGKAIKVLLERGTIVSGLYLFIDICIVLEHHYLAVSYGTRETLHINKEQGWSQRDPCGTLEMTGRSLGILPSRRDLLNNTVEDGAFIGAVSLRNLARISSGPVAFSGFNASRID